MLSGLAPVKENAIAIKEADGIEPLVLLLSRGNADAKVYIDIHMHTHTCAYTYMYKVHAAAAIGELALTLTLTLTLTLILTLTLTLIRHAAPSGVCCRHRPLVCLPSQPLPPLPHATQRIAQSNYTLLR